MKKDMKCKKKKYIVASVLACLFVFGLIINYQKVWYERELSWANEPDQYNVYTYQIGGSGIGQSQSEVSYVTEHGYLKPADKYALISFNSSKDLMWANCADGYMVTKCNSNDSRVSFDPYGGVVSCGLFIDEKPKSLVTYTCNKNSQKPPKNY